MATCLVIPTVYEPWKFLDREGETEYISGLLALGFELMRRVERGQYGGINFWTEIGALAKGKSTSSEGKCRFLWTLRLDEQRFLQ